MECNFKIGQKVVCINDERNKKSRLPGYRIVGDLGGLTKNEIYTIRDVFIDGPSGTVLVHLEEIRRGKQYPKIPDSPEAGYHPSRFRPLRDLTIFHEILRKANVPNRELSDIDA